MNFLTGIGSFGTQIQKQTKSNLGSIIGTGIGIFSSIFGKKEAPSSPAPSPIYPVYAPEPSPSYIPLFLGIVGILLFAFFLKR